MTACRPFAPARAAAELTLRSPLPVELPVQADRFPVSKPSLKITSPAAEVAVGEKVGVKVAVGPGVFVLVGVGVMVGVSVSVLVVVEVKVAVAVFVAVKVGVAVAVLVGVLVGPGVGVGPKDRKLKASRSLVPRPQVLPSKYRVEEYVQAVVLPMEVGTQTNTSSSAPATPLTEKSPNVER